jgi:hypothetical protein
MLTRRGVPGTELKTKIYAGGSYLSVKNSKIVNKHALTSPFPPKAA